MVRRLATREPVNLGPNDVVEAIHAARAERDAQIDAALGLTEADETEGDGAGRG